ncbi:MAG TPA: SDR family NAD(P)-dependent oxidoreductase [Gaiellaceae bacterium]|nr:SDR family NAD(P)-dependent oxidoreductase [Gaiellaceae bacterium]
MGEVTVLVSGATSGIGREIARQFASRGWTVLVGTRDIARGEAVAAEIGGRPLLLDVTDEAGIARAAASVHRLDVLVNNAGISLDTGEAVTDVAVEAFRRTYETNVFGVVAVTNAFLPALRRAPHPRIVNISSGTGSLGWSTGPNPQFDFRAAASGAGAAYRSSKTALNALTVFYAQALRGDGVKVNALAPGLRATNLNPAAKAAGGDPAEAAAAAVRLALLPDDGPTGELFSWDGTSVPW